MQSFCSPPPNSGFARRIAVFILLGGVACALAPAVGADTLTAEKQSELTRLVRQDCGSCHGLTLQGGLGKSLMPDQLAPMSAEQIADVIMEGLAGTPMPPWKGLLRREEALWIASRLKEGFPQ